MSGIKSTLLLLALLVVAMIVGLVQYARGLGDDAEPRPIPDNLSGPAEGGALETGGALDPDGSRRLPARDMPKTIKQYPPAGLETDNPPPMKD